MKFKIEDHDGIDKMFGVGNDHIWMYVDYDDVNHTEVDAAVHVMKKIMEEHWDEKLYEAIYMEMVLDNWNKQE